MKWFADSRSDFAGRAAKLRGNRCAWIALGLCGLALAGWQARAALPRWMQDAVGGSAIEAALYRMMELPFAKALYPRPPKEAQGELNGLVAKTPKDAELYSLRALEEEQALDFAAAEADWKAYAERAADKPGAKLELADYYHRRLESKKEAATLMEVGSTAPEAGEMYVADSEQRSWKAFERILAVAADQGLDDVVVEPCYAAWIARYPRQPSIYARELNWLLEKAADASKFEKAEALIAQYRRAFPRDAVFPLKASALVEYKRGSIDKALAIYDAGFEPLWPPELVQSYFALLNQTHRMHAFLAAARAAQAKDPDDLKAMARLFYAAQQRGDLAAAQQVVEAYRLSKESRKAGWSAQELFTLAQWMEGIHAYPEAARYDFALYHAQGSLEPGASPQAEGLSGAIRILLTAPDQPMELGAGNLTLYRDIATLDRGPGYWNGILSLWLNSTSPEREYHQEEQRAQPYFHRAKAAELLAMLDKQFPSAPSRAALHLELTRALAEYGENALVLKAGNDFLNAFTAPANESDRVAVAMLMADAYARQQDTKGEFALYDRMLTELGAKTMGMPLTAAEASNQAKFNEEKPVPPGLPSQAADGAANNGQEQPARAVAASPAFEVNPGQPEGVRVAGAHEYQELLERYLGGLTATGRLPEALAVLRKELDRNPNDPLLYERLASFLEQNNLSAQQEEVYNQAIQKFQDKGWYDKLARLYLREKKREAFADLTRKVTGIFSGTELESYFSNVTEGGPQLFLQLNLYAYKRFPHDQKFLGNLLRAYQTRQTLNSAAWEKLLREHWADSADLRRQFFDFLSRNGKLDDELAKLHELVPGEPQQKANPAAARELAEAELWQSHFEAGAPLLGKLAEAYPADEELGTEASSVFRSLAYFDTGDTNRAVAIEKNLLAANPADMDRLARIGDIYADAGADASPGHENLAAAAPYWQRMPQVHPGTAEGYLQAATVFWDYFQFDSALGEIREARAKFHKPALDAYEAGAIDEGKRDVDAAIGEYVAASTDQDNAGGGMAATRLMQLARRKATAKMVDEATAKAVASDFGVPALALRERLLKVQKRTAEIGPLLEAALARANTLEQAQAIGAQAQAYALTAVYEHALSRQIALVNDPVQKIELEFDLARSYEDRKDLDDATRAMAQVYADNPRLLGVVRATTDYYWRTKQPAKAIATLAEAANVARQPQPELSRQLLVEAASKANDSGNYAQARELMAPLIDPAHGPDAFNPQYLAVVAESYARAGDNAGLKQFYLAKLDAIKTASLSAEERKQKTVLLRRGLIPALTGMKDYAGAMEQSIAILSAYPEDANASQEASLYALRYGRQEQLAGFATDTVKASPKDSRFAILLGQIQTAFQNYPAAIDAYAHAISIRSDRADVYAAKADLEERLQRLDDACKEYERLYVLSYHNPDWMVKIAAVRARQGRKEEAVKALEQAWIAGHAATAGDYFKVARQLEDWTMLDESLRYAELGVKAEGDALLAGPEPGHDNGEDAQGASMYVRLLTQLRQPERALAVLDAALSAAAESPNAPSLIAEQAAKQGLASVTDSEWRKHRIERRKQTAEQRFRAAVLEMSKIVDLDFTPEEKEKFAGLMDQRWTKSRQTLWVDASAAAGMKAEEAKLRREALLEGDSTKEMNPQYSPFVELERSRMEYVELAKTLEAHAQRARPVNAAVARLAEAEAYRSAGDEKSELRVLRTTHLAGDSVERERYLQLLLKYDVPAFESYGTGSRDEATAVASPNYAVAHSDAQITRASLAARADGYSAPWKNAYSALAGLYFRDVTPVTESAFHAVLGDESTIGERVDRHGGVPGQLAGNVWFYYGMRYGVYRTLAPEKDWPQHDPEDLLAAELERSASAPKYAGLARAYADAGKTASALAEYRHALELAPNSAAVRDAMALLLWQTGKKDAAIAQWREAFAALNRIQDKGPAPESFWTTFELMAGHLGERKLTAQLHAEMDGVLRTYISRNGSYRSSELLKAAFLASATSAEGVQWILSLSSAASSDDSIFSSIDSASWLPAEAREPVLLREIALAQIAAASAGNDQSWLTDRPAQIKQQLALYYVEQKQDAKAEAAIAQLPEERRKEQPILEAQIVLASRGGSLKALLEAYRASAGEPKANPPSNVLRVAAAKLEEAGDKAGALALREFLFERDQSRQELLPTDYLALANARLENGDTAGAVEVLRRLTLLPGDVYTHLDEAAALLEKGHDAEAIEFLSVLAKGVPWNASYALRLARAQIQSGMGPIPRAVAALESVAANTAASYGVRVEAAMALRSQGNEPATLGSEELRLLASGKIAPQEAQKPYFLAARVAAADGGTDKEQRAALLRQAIAIDPAGLSDPKQFSGDALRLRILRTEAAVGHDATALETIQPLLTPPVANPTEEATAGAGDGADETPDTGATSDSADETVDLPTGDSNQTLNELLQLAPLPAAGPETDAGKVALALLIGGIYERTGSPENALDYLKLAAYLEKDKAAHERIEQQAERLHSAIKLEAQNSLRRPAIQKALDQSGVVRPRLTAAKLAHADPFKEDAP